MAVVSIGVVVLYLSVTTVFLGLTVLLAFAALLLKKHRQFDHIPGPPRDSFIFGNIAKIREYHKAGRYKHLLFLQWAEEYGPVYKIFVFHQCIVILSGAKSVKEVLTNSRYPKSASTYKRLHNVCGQRFLGNGLVSNTRHSEWKARRTTINPAFHKKVLQSFMKQFNQTAAFWVHSLGAEKEPAAEFDILDWISLATLDMIGQVGFGVDFSKLQDDEKTFRSALWKVLEGYSAQFRDPLLNLKWSRKAFITEVRKSAAALRSLCQDLLTHRISAVKESQQDSDLRRDILAFIAKCADDDPRLTMEDLVDEVCTLLVAGQETTANMLAFLYKELGRNPDVKQRLLEEVDAVIGDRESVTCEDLARLEYMDQVIKETLRLYPPAMGTARGSVENTTLEGFHIPPGTHLVVSFFVIHHKSDFFPNPESFRPERFEAGKSQPALFTYLPFSLGQRSCAGRHFAMMEAKVLLCKFLQTFDYDLSPDQSFEIQETATLRPKGGTVVRLRTRGPRNDD